jgi:DNA-nicking Smr family endonuclease
LKERQGYRPFKDLKTLYKGRLSQKKPEPLSPEEDLRLFYEAMADVKEIKEFRRIPYKRRSPRIKRSHQKRDDSIEILKKLVSGKLPVDISKTQEYVQWRLPSRSEATVEALHRGDYAVQDFIDLHGYTVAEARAVLEEFLRISIKRGYCCVKVIHGRGLSSPRGPVLKEAVLRWLERDLRRLVLAYATARPNDGGLGATYVLLRTKF